MRRDDAVPRRGEIAKGQPPRSKLELADDLLRGLMRHGENVVVALDDEVVVLALRFRKRVEEIL